MVEDRITDGKRIAQLLASELTGLSTPPLDRIEVVDADPDAGPSGDGTFAYGVDCDGERVGDVFVHESAARIELGVDGGAAVEAEAIVGDVVTDGLSVSEGEGGLDVCVERGAAVKRAVDLVVAFVESR